ncbi:hypothetical protein RintRC_6926 [Richelia intracellularis]|nr:hypothetical protein RintRC_6926 [Richelia intracellularis]
MICTDVGFDPGKQIHGPKRFITVDLLGLVLRVLVTSATVPERARLAPARSGRFIR